MEGGKLFYFGGYAKYPDDTSGHQMFGYFGIGLEVDPENWEIVDVASTFVSELGCSFFKSTLVGKRMNEGGIAEAIKEIENRYFAKGKKTIIAAMIDAEKNFQNYLQTRKSNVRPQDSGY
ncbi:MAG: DUF3870 domain-containing protein [Thermovirgaceae bacterium]|jgi:hypothetical protein|nr:DUF3870 domain-containing protein [Synergistales bacterium]MDI9391693.1 DUF3870 domain-containing protein [Synergistota bacterium]MDY0178287.1 DUF3870 domain-containing protein [Synergistaceae bacterium]HRW86940.1 DUF3870 domain-containing protein [Thermovirgaceae bacterium]MDD3133186.1 DUF3870 domain-containing protein [Synergistales bacterium]